MVSPLTASAIIANGVAVGSKTGTAGETEDLKLEAGGAERFPNGEVPLIKTFCTFRGEHYHSTQDTFGNMATNRLQKDPKALPSPCESQSNVVKTPRSTPLEVSQLSFPFPGLKFVNQSQSPKSREERLNCWTSLTSSDWPKENPAELLICDSSCPNLSPKRKSGSEIS